MLYGLGVMALAVVVVCVMRWGVVVLMVVLVVFFIGRGSCFTHRGGMCYGLGVLVFVILVVCAMG